jgi:NADH dehydrogenase/NADH:ubiquinone oxidoreductase subunit G
MIELTIDNKKVSVPKGTSVLEAARMAEIHIPTLCYEPRLKPHGGCRLCIVEVKGMARPISSCTTPVAQDMQVTTNSGRLYRLRRTVVELLLSDHPNDCMVCARAGDCSLQELAYTFGLRLNRFAGATREYDDHDENPFIERDMEKCILCGRCVRVCDEIMGVNAIDFAYRGFASKICPPFEKDLDCEFCGQCLSVCPTGALTNKVRTGENRRMDVKYTDTICPYCGCGCNITLHTVRDKIVGVTSKPNTINDGWLCVKGRFAHDFVNSPDRLTTPLIRKKKGGKLKPASWDEALDLIADRLGGIRDKHGPDALAGLASGRVTNEANYAFQKFFRAVIGTNNIDHCARL